MKHGDRNTMAINVLSAAMMVAVAMPGMVLAQEATGVIAEQAESDEPPASPGSWTVYWDNTLTYNFGVRAESMDDRIGNNPNFDESDYRFKDSGDVVTNRIALMSEFGANYGDRGGFRISAQGWRDFAYDRDVQSNPGIYAPAGGGLPAISYASTGAYSNGRYTGYVDRYFRRGGQLLDAFAFYNGSIGDKPLYIKVGRLTQYWGNALFSAFQGISYSQGGLDGAAAAAAPGTQAKALFIPRTQVNLSTNLTPTVSVGMQYFFEFQQNRLPEGGTYLAPADFLFTNQDNFFAGVVPSELLGLPAGGYVPLNVGRGQTRKPGESNGNFGVNVRWQSTSLRQWGFYYRRLDEVQPWAPLLTFDQTGTPTSYFLAYNQKVDLLGVSLDAAIGDMSVGLEASYRDGTALNSVSSPAADDPYRGATGNVLNLIGNVMVPLGSTHLYDTGSLIAEVAYTHLFSVDSENRALYNGTRYAGCSSGNKWDGCSTDDAVAATVQFEPQWLQVFPGVDLSAPLSVTHGLYGNPAVLGATMQGATSYSVGVTATIASKNILKLAYVGTHAHVNGVAYTPSGLPYYASGNGNYSNNDRDWISLTFITSF